MPAWTSLFDLSLLKWAVRQPERVHQFAPTLRLIAIACAVVISLALWCLIIAAIVWLFV